MKNNKSNRYTIVISPWSFIYLLLALVVIWVILQISSIIISLMVAGIFAIALNPIVTALERKLKVRRGFAVAIVVLAIIVSFLVIIALILPTLITQAKTLANAWPTYRSQVQEFANQQPYTQYIYEKGTEIVRDNTARVSSNVTTISIGVAGGIFSFLTFFLFLIYMLASGRKFAVLLSEMLPNKQWRQQFVKIMNDISNKLGWWLRGQAILCLIVFITSYIGLTIIGVDFALTLALIAGLMEAVPMIGAYIGALPAVIVALLTGSPIQAVIVAAFFLILQQLEGNIIVPQVMNKAVGVHPMLILLAAMIGGTLLGFVGVLIAVPITAAASVIIGSLYQYYNDTIDGDDNNVKTKKA